MIQVMLFGFGKARAWICMDSPNIVGFAMWCRMSAVWCTSDAICRYLLYFRVSANSFVMQLYRFVWFRKDLHGFSERQASSGFAFCFDGRDLLAQGG